MKLNHFKYCENYIFEFDFENGIHKIVDISALVKSKLTLEDLNSAHIDKDWGCLEFKDGMVDIDPKTLYNFSMQ